MICKFYFVLMLAITTFGQFPSPNDYLFGIHDLLPQFNPLNEFDKHYAISNAAITSPVNIKLPSREDMIYYNYYTAAINCPYKVRDLSCVYCGKIKNDITDYIILENDIYHTSALVAVSKVRKEFVISFRSSENFWNVLLVASLINATPFADNNIKVNLGLYIAAMSLYDEVVKTIAAFRKWKIEYAAYKIVLTGHSLGAAMARLTSFYMIDCNQFPGTELVVIGFGEVRSGNKNYVDYLNGQNITSARVTSRADIACHFPPVAVLGTTIAYDYYYHALNEYHLKDVNGNVAKFSDPSVYEDIYGANSLGPLYTPTDHLTYFDVEHSTCMADFLLQFSAVPKIIVPVRDVPQFPKFIETTVNDISTLLGRLVTPIFG